MDSSYIDETTTTTTTTTTTSESPSVPLPMEITKSPISDKLCRMGSGTSVIIDAENGVEAESRKLPSSRFKGVVPQPNGRWGAQIYEKHQRVWLGTFNEEEEAAKAYDVAAQRFRGRDAITNFKLVQGTEENGLESVFLSSHSKAEIVDMLRKHTYNDELQQSRRSLLCNFVTGAEISINQSAKSSEPLFEKTVTPSDVGKLNRLVIPKQHAERHFPLQNGNNSKGILLNFEDVGGKVWRFRYSYWNSSQSYVLTKGWSRFVKEKGLKAGDIVTFMRSIGSDNQQLYIDWKERSRTGSVISGSAIPGLTVEPVQMFRLFGVNIAKGALVDSNKNGGLGFKRRREMELFEFDLSKKIKVINAL